MSPLQEKQLTGMGGNVRAIEIRGTFDDCQRLVKEAFRDKELNAILTLASANSINIARLLPQMFYYIYLATRFTPKNGPLVVSVPSGNFGNLSAGLIAKRMGAPIHTFVAATNQNDTVLRYLETGEFAPVPSVATISNAMDVGNPSNFARMLELYDHAVSKMQHDVYGVRFRDDQTRQAIADVFEKYQYSMDPHGAVAYLGLASFQKEHDSKSTGIFIETAHPAKFAEVVEPIIGRTIPLPPQLAGYITREKRATLMNTELSELRAFLRDVY